MNIGVHTVVNKSVPRSKLPHDIFEPHKMNDVNMITESDLDSCIDCAEQFSGRNNFYFGNGNSRNGVPMINFTYCNY